MLVRQLDFVGLTVWWGTTVRSYSLLRDNCKILQFFQSTDSFFWQLSMAHWQLSHWQLSDLTVVRSDSCLIWQLSALTVVRSDSCPILQMSDLTANIWQLSPNPRCLWEPWEGKNILLWVALNLFTKRWGCLKRVRWKPWKLRFWTFLRMLFRS